MDNEKLKAAMSETNSSLRAIVIVGEILDLYKELAAIAWKEIRGK